MNESDVVLCVSARCDVCECERRVLCVSARSDMYVNESDVACVSEV